MAAIFQDGRHTLNRKVAICYKIGEDRQISMLCFVSMCIKGPGQFLISVSYLKKLKMAAVYSRWPSYIIQKKMTFAIK